MAYRGYSGRSKKSIAGSIAAVVTALFVLALAIAAAALVQDALVFTPDGPVIDLTAWFPM